MQYITDVFRFINDIVPHAEEFRLKKDDIHLEPVINFIYYMPYIF